jgi:hypothetical protein
MLACLYYHEASISSALYTWVYKVETVGFIEVTKWGTRVREMKWQERYQVNNG